MLSVSLKIKNLHWGVCSPASSSPWPAEIFPHVGSSLMGSIIGLRGVLIPWGLGGLCREYERPCWSRLQQLSANSHFGTLPSQCRLFQSLEYS